MTPQNVELAMFDDDAEWLKANRKCFGFYQSDCAAWLTGRMQEAVNSGRICEAEKRQREVPASWKEHLQDLFNRSEEKQRNGESPRDLIRFN